VVKTWLGLECDVEAILDTADADLWAVSSAGEKDADADNEPEEEEEDKGLKDKDVYVQRGATADMSTHARTS